MCCGFLIKNLTSVQVLSSVDSVSNEVCFLGAGFLAVRAFIRFLSHGSSLVYNKSWVLGEGLPTLPALVGLLSCVSPLVEDEVWLLEKGFSTFTASIGLLTYVDSIMDDEAGLLGERFSTFFADIEFLSYMRSLVFGETWLVGEGFVTFWTLTSFSPAKIVSGMKRLVFGENVHHNCCFQQVSLLCDFSYVCRDNPPWSHCPVHCSHRISQLGCVTSSDWWEKPFPHLVHLWSFSSLSAPQSTLRASLQLKVFLHWLHSWAARQNVEFQA